MNYDHISDRMNPDEFRAFRQNIYSLMNNSAEKALQSAELDIRDQKFIEDTTLYKRMTIEEREEYDKLYLAYKEAESKFFEYKNYVSNRVYRAGLMSTEGSMYFTEKEI